MQSARYSSVGNNGLPFRCQCPLLVGASSKRLEPNQLAGEETWLVHDPEEIYTAVSPP